MKKIQTRLLLLISIMAAAILTGCKSQQLYKPDESKIHVSASDFTGLHSFTAKSADGSVYTEELLKDTDVTVINVWSIGCQACIDEMADLAAYADTLPDNIQLVLYCADRPYDRERMDPFLEKSGYTGINWITGKGDLKEFRDQVRYVPTTVFVDCSGNIVGDPLVGKSDDLVTNYTTHINSALSELGKPSM